MRGIPLDSSESFEALRDRLVRADEGRRSPARVRSVATATPMKVFIRYWVPVLAYVGLIFVVSAQPGLRPPLHFDNADKLAHFGEYGILGVLIVRALGTLRQGSPLRAGLLAIALGVLIGTADELFQASVPGRDPSALDLLADTVGLTVAQLVFAMIRRD